MYTVRRDAQKGRVMLSLVGMIPVDEAQKMLEQCSKEYDASGTSLSVQVDLSEYVVSVAAAVDLIAQNLANAAKKQAKKIVFIMPGSNFVNMQIKRIVKQVGVENLVHYANSAGEARRLLDA